MFHGQYKRFYFVAVDWNVLWTPVQLRVLLRSLLDSQCTCSFQVLREEYWCLQLSGCLFVLPSGLLSFCSGIMYMLLLLHLELCHLPSEVIPWSLWNISHYLWCCFYFVFHLLWYKCGYFLRFLVCMVYFLSYYF